MKCPACSAELGNPQQFCTKCGTRLVASPGVPSPSKIGFATIVGQKTVIERLRQAINNFSLSRGPADHILLVGPDGMGKRSIACAFAEELGTRVKEVDATTLERLGDLTSVLTAISSSDVLLIRNIGSLRLVFKELLVNALLENRIELLIGRGPGARKHRYDTSRFICIASVQKESDCPPELREAFLLTVPMQDYSEVEMEKLAVMLSQRQDLHIDPLVVPLIVAASRGIPTASTL